MPILPATALLGRRKPHPCLPLQTMELARAADSAGHHWQTGKTPTPTPASTELGELMPPNTPNTTSTADRATAREERRPASPRGPRSGPPTHRSLQSRPRAPGSPAPPGAARTAAAATGRHAVAGSTAPSRPCKRNALARRQRPAPSAPREGRGAPPPPATGLWPAAPPAAARRRKGVRGNGRAGG